MAVDPTPYSILFKPYMGISPVITLAYPADANEGPSGALVIGIPDLGTTGHRINWPDIRPTRNIIIDGSNTEGGTTRDLTIQNATTAHRNGIPMVIVGDAQDITVKNTNLYYQPAAVSTSGGLFIGAVMIRARYDFVPKNLLFENNHLNANFDGVPQNAQGIGTYCASSTMPTGDYPNGITIKNNLIEGKRRGIGLDVSGNTDILNNEIMLNQNIVNSLTNEAIFAYVVKAGAIINIQNNTISKVSSKNSTATTAGIAAISIETAGTYNIFNNMITGFELTAANPSTYVYGVKNSSASATMNLYYNTLVMNDLADVGTGSVNYYGLHLVDGTNNIKNNIVVNNEDNFKSYNFYRPGSNGTIVSDYNDLYRSGTTNAKTGSWNGTDAASLADWQTASGLDASSVAKMVEFVAASDLHLTGTSVGDFDLAGTPLAEVTTDIDGETRSTVYPYMGADEDAVELKKGVPVTIPDTSAVQEASIALPILVSDVTDLGIYSYSFTITFDQQVIDAIDASVPGTITEPWGSVTTSDSAGKMTVAVAGSAPLAGSGVLIYINFKIVGAPESKTDITFSKFVFNEGLPSVNIKPGSLNVISMITIITVDGNKDAFYETLMGVDDGYLQVKYYAGNDNGNPYNNIDLSAQIWAAWDNDWFYLYEEVMDDTVAGDATNVYEEDCIELKFDAQPTDSVTNSVWDTRLTALGKATAGVVSADSLSNVADADKQWARKIIPGGYALELAIKWSAIGHINPERNESITPAVDNVFGLALCQHDNDGKARRQASLAWGAVMLDAVWNTPKYLGTVKFLADNKLQFIPRNNMTGRTNPVPYDGTPFFVAIDGKKDPVYNALRGPNDGYLQIRSYAYNDNGTPVNDADLSAKVWTAWDDQWFYLYEEVKDDTLSGNATNVWEEDCIELKFDPQATDSVANSVWDTRFTALGKAAAGVVAADSLNNVADSLKKWTRTKITGGYALEMAIKWSVIRSGTEIITPAVDNVFGMAICQHDNDGKGRQASLGWSAALLDAVWNTPKYHGTVKFLADNKMQFIPKNNVTGLNNPIPYDGRNYTRTGVAEEPVELPKVFRLEQNYPNPFNPSTSIDLAIPENADVEINVYNILGQKVAEVFKGKLNAGYHKFEFNATNLTSGVYIYRVKANHFESVKKMTILK